MTNYNQTTTVCDEQQKPVKWWNRINHKYIWAVVISAIVAIGWIASPIDLIPDVVIGLGQIDDLLVACVPVVTSYMALKQSITAVRNK